MSSMITLSYTAMPKLFPLIVFRMVRLSVTYGNIPLSAQAYAMYGIILCGAVGDIDTGYQFGTLASNLIEQLNARELKASVTYMVQTFVRHWKEHIRETLQPLVEGYQIGLETGDLIFGTLNAQGYGFQAYWLGAELTGLEREMAKYSDAIRHLKQAQALNINEIYRQLVLNLLGRAENPCRLIGESYDEEAELPLRLQANDANTVSFIFSSKVVLCYLFQEYHQAIEHAAVAEKYLDSLLGTAAIPAFHMYDSLARLAVFLDAEESEKKNILERVAANQDKMKLWAQHAPMNFLHKFHLVEAERARVLGNESEAREQYDRAIDLAREHEYVNEEALANELAAKFYLARGQVRIAHHYLRDAHYAYLRWGAMAKVRDLETRYPQFFETRVAPNLYQPVTPTSIIYTEQHMSTALDTRSVLKASQAIASEIVLDRLLARLMRIVIENAGAQRGVLILKRDGQLVIEAEGTVDEAEGTVENVRVLQTVPVGAHPSLPMAIIHYVERTKEYLVLSDATQEPVLATDPYITKEQPKSVLCTPLVKQGKLTGMLYLENNLATGAFTPDRVEVLNLLAAEAAISIENAQLYKNLEEANEQLAEYSRNLEQKVEERTQVLQEKNRELELANQQVQEASRRKSQFLAGMSHELRTPMNAILGFTRLVLRRAGELLPERQRNNLEKVKESADNLLSLINQLLDLSRLEAGRMEVHPGPFDVRRFILSCCEMVSPLVKPGVRLRQEIAEEVGEAHTDEEGLRHVVINLLSNAIKFTDAGEVTVRVRMEGQAADAALMIAVSDTGVGIPTEALDSIFEEFQQVEGGVQKREGSGLGLPIARRWAELLGGSIVVTSELEKGSMFLVTVPAVYRNQPEKSAESVNV
jgi:signal transduction histidine kinase